MMASENKLRVLDFLKSHPEIWEIAKSCVYRTPNKDEAAEVCMAIFEEGGLIYTSDGTRISKTSIRFAMREIW